MLRHYNRSNKIFPPHPDLSTLKGTVAIKGEEIFWIPRSSNLNTLKGTVGSSTTGE